MMRIVEVVLLGWRNSVLRSGGDYSDTCTCK